MSRRDDLRRRQAAWQCRKCGAWRHWELVQTVKNCTTCGSEDVAIVTEDMRGIRRKISRQQRARSIEAKAP